MKKIMLASMLLCSVFFASATVKADLKIASKLKIENNKPQWEIRFSCDGGTTWGTFGTFNSQAEAQAWLDAHPGQLCAWAN